jgi:DNA-binding PadR family transcriptional regulator
MTGSHRSHSSAGFGPGQAADAMWQTMEQLRSSFDKKVGTRMGRGDVRSAVLALLTEKPMHGYQMIREIEERTGGRWKPSAGSVYPTLQLLSDEGVVTVETANDRKTYSLTEEGKEEATAAAASAPWETDTSRESGAFGAVPKAGIDLAQAVTHMVRSGSAAQQEKAVEVLADARRKIYSILAQD